MIKYIFLLIILISIQIKASPHTTTPTIESNNLSDFTFVDDDLLWDYSNITDNITFDALVLDSLSYSPYPQNINKILEKNSNTCNEADNLLKQDIPDNNHATALNDEELESNYNEIIELIQHNSDEDNSSSENIDNLAKDEVADNYNLTDENKINSNTEKNFENNLAKDKVDDNYNLTDESKINSNTEENFENSENNLVNYANNSLTSTKDSITTEFAPRRVVNIAKPL